MDPERKQPLSLECGGLNDRHPDLCLNAIQAYRDCVAEPLRRSEVQLLTDSAAQLDTLVRCFEGDDEIINWVFSDAESDLQAAIWCAASGFYKAAACGLRTALDVGMAALYFQFRDELGQGRFYTEWDHGVRDTPSWGETMPYLKEKCASLQRFSAAHRCDLAGEVWSFFGSLSNFTHSRAYSSDGNPTTSMNWIGGSIPSFNVDAFATASGLIKTTIGWIGTMWLATLGDRFDLPTVERLNAVIEVLRRFPVDRGAQALAAARGRGGTTQPA